MIKLMGKLILILLRIFVQLVIIILSISSIYLFVFVVLLLDPEIIASDIIKIDYLQHLLVISPAIGIAIAVLVFSLLNLASLKLLKYTNLKLKFILDKLALLSVAMTFIIPVGYFPFKYVIRPAVESQSLK